jgi:hypothetical protein
MMPGGIGQILCIVLGRRVELSCLEGSGLCLNIGKTSLSSASYAARVSPAS